MLTQSKEDDDLFDSLRAGASGYLLKDLDPAALPAALRGVLAGEAAMPPGLVTRILQEFRGPSRQGLLRKPAAADKLSAREWEVMELLSQGESTEEVAQAALRLTDNGPRARLGSAAQAARQRPRERLRAAAPGLTGSRPAGLRDVSGCP